MLQNLIALLCGLLFALGLGLSQMTSPVRVRGFLDILGAWDPSLIFVMAGAIASYAGWYWGIIRRRPKPVICENYQVPSSAQVDSPLILGSALFGVGWGLAGYCPGPAVVSLVTLKPRVLVFVAAMVVGMLIFQWLERQIRR